MNIGPAWVCYAKPVATGVMCTHVNDDGGKMFSGLICCGECGCTKAASDARLEALNEGKT